MIAFYSRVENSITLFEISYVNFITWSVSRNIESWLFYSVFGIKTSTEQRKKDPTVLLPILILTFFYYKFPCFIVCDYLKKKRGKSSRETIETMTFNIRCDNKNVKI